MHAYKSKAPAPGNFSRRREQELERAGDYETLERLEEQSAQAREQIGA